MNQNPLLGIDLDDVLLDFNSSLCVYHNQTYNTNYERSDVTNYHFDVVWGCPMDEAVRRIGDFYHTDLHWNSSPMEGAVEAIKRLKQKYNLVIVTAKPDYLKEKTFEWLNKHFPNIFEHVYFTGHYHGTGPKRSKREICDELGIHIFIEDSMSNAMSIQSENRPVILLDSPWNQGQLEGNIKRVKGWDEILEVLS